MKSSKARRRKLWVGTAVLFWVAVGVSVPLIFDFESEEFQFDSAGVVAAPRDSFQITSPLIFDRTSRAVLSGGTLAIAASKENNATAESTAKLLQNGEAVLLLQNGELTIGLPVEAGVAATANRPAAPLVEAVQSGRFKAFGLRQSTIIIALPNGHRERLTRANVQMVQSGGGSIDARGEGFWRGQRSKFALTSAPPDKGGNVPVTFKFHAALIDLEYDGVFQLGGAHSAQGAARVRIKNTER
ncbi:MAG: hypothetical protein KKB37_10705, partial [Alphaproteobacteria bacterium]|nr:hypothetical protein [Alphaproteobacteria bacterium]